jgi:prepilin-type N-terminal cleavage/methylation domain-containing protein
MIPVDYMGRRDGFTLVELVFTIIVIAVLATLAVRTFTPSLDRARHEHTLSELDQLANAIEGNQDIYSRGGRVDFGYVGDVGALPLSLDDLISNPGGYTTWDGPYVEPGSGSNDFRTDGWGSPYIYADTLIRSTGSGSNIDRLLGASADHLLSNDVKGWVSDASGERPPARYRDSLEIEFVYPDGLGGLATIRQTPGGRGEFLFANIPVGVHQIRVIWLPAADTITQQLTVYPGRDAVMEVTFPADLF